MGKITIATYGPRNGVCNICGKLGPLTEDHTPPKGCIRVAPIAIQHIVDRLGASPSDVKGRVSQNGIKYRTLCSKCNNSLLGSAYDPALIDFVNTVGSYIKSTLTLPKQMSLPTRPQKIMRAVLGHLAAQGVNRYDKGEDTEPLRDYLLDPNSQLPNWIRIYHWVYPYASQVVIRDCAYMDLRGRKQFVIWLLKFYPSAFLVTWRQPLEHSFSLPALSEHGKIAINDEVDFPVPLDRIPHERWPEAPTDQSILLYGQEAIMASERARTPLPANSVFP